MSGLSLSHATPPFRTFCGDSAFASVPRELQRLGSSRVVIITGPWYSMFPDAFGPLEAALGDALVATWDQVEDHSPVPSVENAAALLTEVGADAVIAVGGGSCVVTARAATIVLAEQKSVRELATYRGEDGKLVSPRLNAPKIPNWVVPSTPITAYARVGTAVRDNDTGERLALYDPKTRAQGLFLDPRVALTAPAGLAAGSAMNSFSMAVEALQAGDDDPLADALLLHALRMLGEWMPRVLSEPDDAEPRLRLMLAALLCGQGSEYVGGGLAQALSHATGPRSSVSNGVIEALLLPHTMRFNLPVTSGRLGSVAESLRHSGPGGYDDDAAIGAVESVVSAMGIPARLRDVGVSPDSFEEIIEHALDDWFITRVPRPVSRELLHELLDAAW